jgi:hypothetical protein
VHTAVRRTASGREDRLCALRRVPLSPTSQQREPRCVQVRSGHNCCQSGERTGGTCVTATWGASRTTHDQSQVRRCDEGRSTASSRQRLPGNLTHAARRRAITTIITMLVGVINNCRKYWPLCAGTRLLSRRAAGCGQTRRQPTPTCPSSPSSCRSLSTASWALLTSPAPPRTRRPPRIGHHIELIRAPAPRAARGPPHR